MPGPVAYGVFKALEDKRRTDGRKPSRFFPGQGWFVFVVAAMSLSWLVAGLLADHPPPTDERVTVRLWYASLYYAATMGWQPLAAAWFAARWRDARRGTDAGLRWPRMRDIGLALVLAGGIAAAAMVIAGVAGEPLHAGSPFVGGATAPLAAIAAMLVLCLQAVTEEYGWRGAPLAYAVERWGRPGLVVHGAMWGVWYAPLFILSSAAPRDSFATAGGFVVTCMLLGIVFGWLRLRSKSVLPSAIANALLTILAGLPLLLRDGSAGIRDAVFRWPGWPILALAAVIVLFVRPARIEEAT